MGVAVSDNIVDTSYCRCWYNRVFVILVYFSSSVNSDGRGIIIITDKQREWLQKIVAGEPKPKYYGLYMNRVQKQIDKNINNVLWLAKHRPDILLDEGGFGDKPRHQRLQALMLIIKILKPHYNVILEMAKDIEDVIL